MTRTPMACLPWLIRTIVQIIFLFYLGPFGPFWYLWKWSAAHVYARGRKQCCKLRYCLWRVSIKPRLPFSVSNVFFVSKGSRLYFYFEFLEFSSDSSRKQIFRDILGIFSYFIKKMYVMCTYKKRLIQTILMSTFNIPLFYRKLKRCP